MVHINLCQSNILVGKKRKRPKKKKGVVVGWRGGGVVHKDMAHVKLFYAKWQFGCILVHGYPVTFCQQMQRIKGMSKELCFASNTASFCYMTEVYRYMYCITGWCLYCVTGWCLYCWHSESSMQQTDNHL